MRKKLVNFSFLIAIICAFCAPAAAWNDVGHKLTAYIAWQRMSPEARAAVIKILHRAPEDSHLSALYPHDSRSEAARQQEFFMNAAFWADIVRDRNYPQRHKYHRGNWHYSDYFWRQENGRVVILNDFEEDGGKAVEKLIDFEKDMRSAEESDAEKAIAIAWFLHLVGDLHQPLHTSGRVTELEPKGDQGANTFLLSPKDAPREQQLNLHWFWDSIINRVVPRRNDACDADYLVPIANQIMRKYPFPAAQTRLQPGQFEAWKKESFDIATSELFPPMLVRHQMPPAAYTRRAFQIAEQQIAMAGYRMGQMLNEIFGKAATARATGEEPCQIIRRIPYPVTKRPADQKKKKTEIALLNICPPDRGKIARPVIEVTAGGKTAMREYDVQRVFKSEAEARRFAEQNKIKDASF